MAMLPLPDISHAYTDGKGQASKTFYNWAKSLQDTVNSFQSTGSSFLISVKSPPFNAKGDGVTNDTGSFNACYAYCDTNNLVMTIPPGTYIIDGVVWDKMVNVIGAGPGEAILKPSSDNMTVVKVVGISPDDRALILSVGGFSILNTTKLNIIGIHLRLCINYHFLPMTARGPDTGILSDGCQFCTHQELSGIDCTTGVRIVDDLDSVAGGGNNNQFNSIDTYNNIVGLVVGRGVTVFGQGNNIFFNLVCQLNSLCGAYFRDQGSSTITNYHPERNCEGAPNSMTIDGELILKSPLHCVGSSLILFNFQNNDIAPVISQFGSDLKFHSTGGAKAFIVQSANNVTVWDGRAGNSSELHNCFLHLSDDGTGPSMALLTASQIIEDQAFPNLTPTPSYPPAAGGTNCASFGYTTDEDLGIVTQAIFNPVAGDQFTNQIKFDTAAAPYGISFGVYLSFLIKSDTEGDFGIFAASGLLNFAPFTLLANKWTRIFLKAFNNTGFTVDNSAHIYPLDTNAAAIQVARMISCQNLDSLQIRLLSEAHHFNPLDVQGIRAVLPAAPAFGTWKRGDIVWNSLPASAGFIGFVCIAAGSPGTWTTWGTIT